MAPRGYCPDCDDAVDVEGDWPGACTRCGRRVDEHPVADVLGPDLRVLFVGINPGVQTARGGHHFANRRNLFWPLVHEAGFTPRRLDPAEEGRLPAFGAGITNVVTRATPGSGDVRAEDKRRGSRRLAGLVEEVAPAWVAFVGKQAYTMATGTDRPAHGVQRERFAGARAFVLPSTSPANAAVPRDEKLHWFRRLYRLAFESDDA